MEIDLEQLRDLMRSLSEFDVTEVELEKGKASERIVIRREGRSASAPLALHATPDSIRAMVPSLAAPSGEVAPAPGASAGGGAASAAPEDDTDPNIQFVTSPFVGTFYRSPSPEGEPFVQEGQTVQAGAVLCIVEAMKLMNEIEAEASGTIVSILVDNGKPVEYGDRLFKIRRS